jgi:hypothetical protein
VSADRREPRLRVLVMTNHFKWYAGSEIVALEVAHGFAALGDDVTFAANVIGAPMSEHISGFRVTDEVSGIDLAAFDLVWCQHDLLSLLPVATYERASNDGVPYIAYVSLSPFEPYETLNGVLARALSADVLANSAETADAVAAANEGIIERSAIHVFHNAAPQEFWARRERESPPPPLKSVLFVSNHPPPEIDACAAMLTERGISVRRMGLGHELGLLRPADVAAADALVSIGKTVCYAIAMGKPAFIYDHFGGDGWLRRGNFEQNRHFNFSGRPHRRLCDPEALLNAALDGYDAAAQESARFGESFDLSAFQLETHLSTLRTRAMTRSSGARQQRLKFMLTQPTFRAHLEACRSKGEVMRSLRRQIDAV